LLTPRFRSCQPKLTQFDTNHIYTKSIMRLVKKLFNRVWGRFPAALRRNIQLAIRILEFGSKSASLPRLIAAGFLIDPAISTIFDNRRDRA
jgi:hypothetical protein